MAQSQSSQSQSQSIGATNAKDGNRWNLGAMKKLTESKFCGFARHANEDENIA
jgi:hypothetical protein